VSDTAANHVCSGGSLPVATPGAWQMGRGAVLVA